MPKTYQYIISAPYLLKTIKNNYTFYVKEAKKCPGLGGRGEVYLITQDNKTVFGIFTGDVEKIVIRPFRTTEVRTCLILNKEGEKLIKRKLIRRI